MVQRRSVDAVRRHVAMRLDQAWALIANRLAPTRSVPFDGDVRIGLVTVNFSTTRYLKLLLLTLCGQHHLGLVHRVVIVDNGSRDGGLPFLRELASRVPRVLLVERRHGLTHARGMRAAVRALDRIDDRDVNVLLFCDPDVILRDADAIATVAGVAMAEGPALLGEVRTGPNPAPDIQASFFAVRRDVYARRDIAPLVHHGSPAYRMQRSIWRAGLPVADFPSNRGGFVLHRGRTAVAAAGRYRRWHPYASVANRSPHFMGVEDGEAVWVEIESRHARLLDQTAERELLDVLTDRLAVLGTATFAD